MLNDVKENLYILTHKKDTFSLSASYHHHVSHFFAPFKDKCGLSIIEQITSKTTEQWNYKWICPYVKKESTRQKNSFCFALVWPNWICTCVKIEMIVVAKISVNRDNKQQLTRYNI